MRRLSLLTAATVCAAGLLLTAAHAMARPPAPPAGLKASGAVRCGGHADKTVAKRYIKAAGDAVVADGNCDLTIRDSYVEAGKRGVAASGNSDVKLVNCTVVAPKAAVAASGNSNVSAKGSRFFGAIKKRGNADFEDNGGNKFKKYAAPRGGGSGGGGAEAPSGLKPAKPIKCTGTQRITLKSRSIKARGTAIKLVGTCSLTLVGCHIESGSVAIEQMGTGDVVMRDSTIIGRKAAVSLMGTGNIRAKGCTIVGAVKKTGTGRFIDEGGNTRKKR